MYGFVHGSKLWKCQFGWILTWELNHQGNLLKALLRGISLSELRFRGVPSMFEEVVRVRFCCLVSTVSWKTNTGKTGRTAPRHRLKISLFWWTFSLSVGFRGWLSLGGKFWAPWTHKPRNGLLRTLCGFQKVLRRPVRGFPCTGCTQRSSCRATEDTLNT